VFTPPFRDKRYTLVPGEMLTQTSTAVTTTNFPPAPLTTTTNTTTQIVRYLGQENVTVPAGTFATCKFEFENLTTWEAKGKGIQVKSITSNQETTVLTSGTINGSPVVP
jgi:hypothetical protein